MVEMLRTYDFKRKQPVFELERIMFRDNAIYHDILPGYAEHRLLMGLPVEAKMYDSHQECGAHYSVGALNGRW